MAKEQDDFWILTCPVCKKKFACTDRGSYAYKKKINGKVKKVCSWTCYRRL